jgi:hypothetical protein
MYIFKTISDKTYFTKYSPLEISKLQCFDAFDCIGDCFVIPVSEVNFKSFEFIF